MNKHVLLFLFSSSFLCLVLGIFLGQNFSQNTPLAVPTPVTMPTQLPEPYPNPNSDFFQINTTDGLIGIKLLPRMTKNQNNAGNDISINYQGSTFEVISWGPDAGLCPPEADTTGCNYVDENSLKDITLLRIWSDNQGVFALNPQGIQVDQLYLDKLIIQKLSPTTIFSDEEIRTFKQFLDPPNMTTLPDIY